MLQLLMLQESNMTYYTIYVELLDGERFETRRHTKKGRDQYIADVKAQGDYKLITVTEVCF